jgi:cobalt-zinc-cadmium efflux system protein
MAHIRRPLAAAAALNAAIFLGEAWAGVRAGSLSLLGDAVHNFSDQLALVCLLLAYLVTTRASPAMGGLPLASFRSTEIGFSDVARERS